MRSPPSRPTRSTAMPRATSMRLMPSTPSCSRFSRKRARNCCSSWTAICALGSNSRPKPVRPRPACARCTRSRAVRGWPERCGWANWRIGSSRASSGWRRTRRPKPRTSRRCSPVATPCRAALKRCAPATRRAMCRQRSRCRPSPCLPCRVRPHSECWQERRQEHRQRRCRPTTGRQIWPRSSRSARPCSTARRLRPPRLRPATGRRRRRWQPMRLTLRRPSTGHASSVATARRAARPSGCRPRRRPRCGCARRCSIGWSTMRAR